MNLNLHLHVVVLDGVFVRDANRESGNDIVFHAAPAPTRVDLEAIVRRVRERAIAWLRRRGLFDEVPLEARSNDAPEIAALDGCAAIAMVRGTLATLKTDSAHEADGRASDGADIGYGAGVPNATLAVEQAGFNLHAAVRIEAGDDLGRERLCRYGARPPFSLERLRRLPGGRVAYRVKTLRGGRAKHRVMTTIEFLARLAALLAPPRYPLTRFHGVLAPRSAWRRDIVPRPPRSPAGNPPQAPITKRCGTSAANPRATPANQQLRTSPPYRPRLPASNDTSTAAAAKAHDHGPIAAAATPSCATMREGEALPEVDRLAPNVLGVRHWSRLLGGLLYATSPRLSWPQLLRRTFEVDIQRCAKCSGRVRVVSAIVDERDARRILERLGIPSDIPPIARARDPTYLDDDEENIEQHAHL